MSYCLLADLKTYLDVTSTSEDVLIQRMLDGATARIDSRTGRNFYAAADSTLYHDYGNFNNGELMLDGDLAYATTVLNGDTTNVTTGIYYTPRRGAAYALGLLKSSGYYWTYGTDVQNSIGITGRWAYMERSPFTAISRATNVVTATLSNAANISVGQSIEVVGVADTGFNGTFTVTGSTASSITWAQTGAADTDTTGYILSAPQDIVTACRRLAAWMYRQKDNQLGDQDRPLMAGDGSIIMPTTLPQDVEMILRPYTRVVLR
jgi:hypothetical protein